MSSTQPPPPEGGGSYGGDPGSSGMPQYPAAPQVPGGDFQQQHIPRPSSVRNAVRLMWAGAAIGLIGIIVSLATMGKLKEQLESQVSADTPESVVHSTYVGTIVGMIVGGVIGVLLWLWMAWKTGQGRHWARILSTIFAAINVLAAVSMLSGAGNAGSGIVQLVSMIVGVVAVVLLWRKDSSEFFNAKRRPVG